MFAIKFSCNEYIKDITSTHSVKSHAPEDTAGYIVNDRVTNK